jgi:hypothetical protein
LLEIVTILAAALILTGGLRIDNPFLLPGLKAPIIPSTGVLEAN